MKIINGIKKKYQIKGFQIEGNYGHALQHKGSLNVIADVGLESNILDLGGGERRLKLKKYVNMDGKKNNYVDVVADAHFLPFKDGAFELVISEHLLEHVRKPWIVIEEIYRITKQKGYVYIEVPFMTPYHPRPHHYFNMTKEGLEQLCERFEKKECGVQPYNMPSFSIAMIFSKYIRCLFPITDNLTSNIEVYDSDAYLSDTSFFGKLLFSIYNIFITILSSFDRFIDPKKAEEIAVAFYFIGTK